MTSYKKSPASPFIPVTGYTRRAHQAALAVPRRAAAEAVGIKIQIPLFPLEVVLRGLEVAPPCVLAEDDVSHVLCANAAAAGLGVRSGVPLKAVTALSPDIHVLRRDAAAEQQVCAHLAHWFHAAGYDAQFGARTGLEIWLNCGATPSIEPLLAQLRRDLRALGLRAYLAESIPLVTALPASQLVRMAPSALRADANFSSLLSLPWPLCRPRELYTAVGRLLADLRVISESRQASVRWVQWTFEHSNGVRDHHLLELANLPRTPERLILWARERLHRLSLVSPLCRLEIKAGF
jgi:hypothetical protein